MGKCKENPSYNVFSLRADDALAQQIREEAQKHASVSDFLKHAVQLLVEPKESEQ